MPPLFSQIPVQVLNKVKHASISDKQVVSKKKVKFYEDQEVRSKKSREDRENEYLFVEIERDSNIKTDDEKSCLSFQDITVEDVSDEPTSSYVDKPIIPQIEQLDAIIQTEPIKYFERASQTDESFITRPLSSTDNDMHRLNMQTYAPIMPIPRRIPGREPPLRIGLTLRGKKRNVFYPGETVI